MKNLYFSIAVALLTLTGTTAQTTQSTAKTTAVEQAYPSYPGGIEEFQKYIMTSVKDASEYKEPMLVTFDVDTNGSVSNIQFQASPGSKYETEIKKLIENGKKWIPAKREGKLVKSPVRVPLRFGQN